MPQTMSWPVEMQAIVLRVQLRSVGHPLAPCRVESRRGELLLDRQAQSGGMRCPDATATEPASQAAANERIEQKSKTFDHNEYWG